jgi:hypothetical protein
MTSIRISFPINDDAKICVHVVDSAGNPIDLAPYTEITFTLKRSTQDLTSEAIFIGTKTGGQIVISNPSDDGICEVSIPAAAGATLMIGRPYFWTLKLTTGTGLVSTPVYGTLLADSPIQR